MDLRTMLELYTSVLITSMRARKLILSCYVLTGDHQQHHHTQHDVHQDIAEVWPVGGQQGQHCVWTGLRFGAATGQGERKHEITKASVKLRDN